jgi:hypothetical protein
VQPTRITYPPAVRFEPKFADEAIDVYGGTISIVADLPKGTLTQMPALSGTVTAQACTDVICLPPSDLPVQP